MNQSTKDATDFENYFIEKGFTLLMYGGRCPFQIEANHCAGFSVYFRARHSAAGIEVYSEHLNYLDGLPDDCVLIIESDIEAWKDEAAGWLDFDEALQAFHFLWTDIKDLCFE